MKVYDLKGRQHHLSLIGYEVGEDLQPRSSFHIRARRLLKSIFPLYRLLEEVPVPGEKLFLDFFIPNLKLVVEVHGQQHYEYNHFFHQDKYNFVQSNKRDRRKAEWCEVNTFRIVVLPFYETDEQWENRIKCQMK